MLWLFNPQQPAHCRVYFGTVVTSNKNLSLKEQRAVHYRQGRPHDLIQSHNSSVQSKFVEFFVLVSFAAHWPPRAI